jgi:PAS domain S-box-containing protein
MTEREPDAGHAAARAPSALPASRRLTASVPAFYASGASAGIALGALLIAESSGRGAAAWWLAGGLAFAACTTVALHVALQAVLRRERRARKDFHRAARGYELLAEHSRDIILFIRREDARILDANAAAAAAYGWSREELRALTVFELRAATAPAVVESQLSQAAAGGVRFETVHRRKDGTSFPVEVTSQGAMVDRVHVLVSVVRDVTERKAAEEALRESEDRLALAVEAAGLGLFHAAPYGRMVWSPRCCEIFGVPEGEIPDFEEFLQLVHPEDREQVRGDADRWLDPRGDGRYQGQYRCIRPDGTVRWIAASGRVRFADVDGVRRPVQLVGAVFDVTELKAAQAQVMQADRLASVGMLAAGVAHEINNPLSCVIAALEYLAQHAQEASDGARRLSPEIAQVIAEAKEGAERVRLVVQDLRTFSSAREGRRTLVDLRSVAESAIHMAANAIRYRARVERQYGPTPAVFGDEARLAQVVLNLLINAAQAIPEGQAADHEIRVVTGRDALGRAFLEVQDTGPGIPDEIVDRIFDPFFTTKPQGVGTGLGLPICRNIVVGLGGEIAVERGRGGRGATLRVSLPPAAGQAETPVPAPVAARSGT